MSWAQGRTRSSAEYPINPGVVAGRRGIGAMFYAVFGGAWIALAAWRSLHRPGPALALVTALTSLLFGLVYFRYRRQRAALAEEPESPARRRRERYFYIINAGQWIVILVAANVLVNFRWSDWVIPMAIFVVGLHFLPLAKLLDNPSQYLTGALFLLLAAVYPFVAPAGARSGVGPLGAGVILWSAALWNIGR